MGFQTVGSEASARLSLLHGSAIFFLAQEASATKAYLGLLSSLYLRPPRSVDGWDRVEFAEATLTSSMTIALDKFLASEEKDGHLIDPNMWRHAIESGGKVALYCTTFASTIVDILNVILEMEPAQFAKQKHVFFPRICALVRVQSNEIRRKREEEGEPTDDLVDSDGETPEDGNPDVAPEVEQNGRQNGMVSCRLFLYMFNIIFVYKLYHFQALM